MVNTRNGARSRALRRFVAAALCVAIAGIVAPSVSGSAPEASRQPASGGAVGREPGGSGSGDDTVAVYVDEGVAASGLNAVGATMVADYGSYSLWRIPASAASGRAGVSPAGDFDKIPLRGTAINTADDVEPAVPGDLRNAASGGKELRLVQFAGPIKPEWVAGLRKSGLTIVSYLPPNAYIVLGDATAVAALARQAATDPLITYEGPFRPAYRLHPALAEKRSAAGEVDVVVQVVEGESGDVAAVKALGAPLAQDNTVAGFTNVELTVPASSLVDLVRLPAVVNVERRQLPQRLDEKQDQIVAGNVKTVGGKRVPTGTGYRAWLQGQGISTSASAHPIVAVVDDGVDNGTANPLHRDFRVGGNPANASRLLANADCTGGGNARGIAGHGNINAGIIGGFNNGTGSNFEDAAGYNYGLGVDPYTRMSNIKIFTDGGAFATGACPGGTYRGIVEREVAHGAKISSNSWGAAVAGDYNVSSQEYDAYARDSSTSTGLQPMLHVFSAGNEGPDDTTLGSPGTAKNVLTVGATENVRDQGVVDGCGLSDADNADDMADFSSRGPTNDLRAKPDLVAPGTHVQGPASQAPGYDGTGVCGPAYYPAGQTLYTWSSGTSHSAPAVSGAAALAYEYYRRSLKPGVNPSPAMTKALVLNTPRYLNGLDTGGTLPGKGQGWGSVNLSQLYRPDRYVNDQSQVFNASGQRAYRYFTIADASKSTRITLTFDDAPGATTGNSYVNDLDLLVVAGGKLYRGNRFSGSASTPAPGGTSDARNNTEQVWLPSGISGRVTVQVLARNIAGNGVPGGAALDQDFALTAVNVDGVSPISAVPYDGGVGLSAMGPGTNSAAGIQPGEPVDLAVTIGNLGTSATAAGKLTATLTSGAGGIIVGTVSTPSVAANSRRLVNGLKLWVGPTAICGNGPTVRIRYAAGARTYETNVRVITTPGSATIASTDVPRAIVDNGTVSSTLNAPGPANLTRLRVRLNISHTWDSDLVVSLRGPGGQTATLTSNNGGNGDNYTNTTFDDTAAQPISSGAPPFSGTFRPETPLSVFTNRSAAGQWRLSVTDTAPQDTGTLHSWSLLTTSGTCAAVPRGVALVNPAPLLEQDGGGTRDMKFKVVRTGPVGAALDVRVRTANDTATAPSDYTARSNVLVHFDAGESTKTVVVKTVKDNVNESDERLKLQFLSVPAGVEVVRSTATGKIVDDD